MRIGLYSPYLNTLGGGERYFLTVAAHLSRQGHRVEIFWEKDGHLKSEAARKLKLDLGKVNFVPLRHFWQTWPYDVLFYVSDGSLPFLFGRKNLLHFQVPFQKVGGRSLLNRIKLSRFNKIIYNSRFTKKYIDREFGVDGVVIYPPVGVEDLRPAGRKENLILSVGRFTQVLHAKKQEFLIQSFREMVDRGLSGWQLVLIGGTQPQDRDFLQKLQKLAAGYQVKILTDVSFGDLKKYYGQAKIYWHAAGFGEDESAHPERTEHFGITVVEAMAAGAVPVVIAKGGIPEIVDDRINGFLWQTPAELQKLTLQLIRSSSLLSKISRAAINKSRFFSQEVFNRKINEIIG